MPSLYKLPFTTQQIGRMSIEELQSNIEKYAKRLNQRIADIERYADDNNLDFEPYGVEVYRALGGRRASRAKVTDLADGRYRLRTIQHVYEKYKRLTRTGMKQWWGRKQNDYSWLFGVDITMSQTMRFNQLTQQLNEVSFDSELWRLLTEHEPVKDAFDGDVDAFIDWIEEVKNRGSGYLDEYYQLMAEKGL